MDLFDHGRYKRGIRACCHERHVASWATCKPMRPRLPDGMNRPAGAKRSGPAATPLLAQGKAADRNEAKKSRQIRDLLMHPAYFPMRWNYGDESSIVFLVPPGPKMSARACEYGGHDGRPGASAGPRRHSRRGPRRGLRPRSCPGDQREVHDHRLRGDRSAGAGLRPRPRRGQVGGRDELLTCRLPRRLLRVRQVPLHGRAVRPSEGRPGRPR